MKNAPAYDQIIQGLSGAMSITGDADSAPLRVGYPVCDTIGGMTAAFAIAAALIRRERTGEGRFIDVSMLDSTLATMGWVVSNYLITGPGTRADGQRQLHRRALRHIPNRRRVCSTSPPTSRSSSWRWPASSAARNWPPIRVLRNARLARRNRAALTVEIEAGARRPKPAPEWEEAVQHDWHSRRPRAERARSAGAAQHQASRAAARDRRRPSAWTGPITVMGGGYIVSDSGDTAIRPPPGLGEHTGRNPGESRLWRAEISEMHAQEGRMSDKKTPEEILAEAQAWWTTAIIDIHPGKIGVRGYAIQDLIGTISFPQMIWLMLRGDTAQAGAGKIAGSGPGCLGRSRTTCAVHRRCTHCRHHRHRSEQCDGFGHQCPGRCAWRRRPAMHGALRENRRQSENGQ